MLRSAMRKRHVEAMSAHDGCWHSICKHHARRGGRAQSEGTCSISGSHFACGMWRALQRSLISTALAAWPVAEGVRGMSARQHATNRVRLCACGGESSVDPCWLVKKRQGRSLRRHGCMTSMSVMQNAWLVEMQSVPWRPLPGTLVFSSRLAMFLVPTWRPACVAGVRHVHDLRGSPPCSTACSSLTDCGASHSSRSSSRSCRLSPSFVSACTSVVPRSPLSMFPHFYLLQCLSRSQSVIESGRRGHCAHETVELQARLVAPWRCHGLSLLVSV